MVVVHIGLGKTATTTLQNHVFPLMEKLRPGLIYNHNDIIRLSKKEHRFGLSCNEQSIFYSIMSKSNDTLISLESLVNWNPYLWKTAADKNLRLFGKGALIIITVRETISYLTSVYQQRVQQGLVINPHEFFVDSSKFKNHDEFRARAIINGDCLDPMQFDLEKLYKIYTDRFSRVVLVPMSEISKFLFLRDAYSLSQTEVDQLKIAFEFAPRMNISYSDLAMRLTFYRERLLDLLHLQSNKSYYCTASTNISSKVYDQKYSELVFKNKVVQFPRRVLKRLFNIFFNWRWLMQEIVNKHLPYNKYRLPNDIENSIAEIKLKNNNFINNLIK